MEKTPSRVGGRLMIFVMGMNNIKIIFDKKFYLYYYNII
jgi:hypothetical protein